MKSTARSSGGEAFYPILTELTRQLVLPPDTLTGRASRPIGRYGLASVRAEGGMTEHRFGTWTVFDVPVLMVDPVVLSNVEPHQSEPAILAPPVEQVADPNGLAGLGPHGGLR